MAERLRDVGEFGLIRRIHDLLKKEGVAPPPGLTVGVGDDAAAFRSRPRYEILVTCDCAVEDRHFPARHVRPREAGRRSMVVNISDIGAMGGRPLYALVSLGLKKDTTIGYVEELYRGFLEELNPFGAVIIGGNLTESAKGVFIDITLIGEVKERTLVRRSTAQPGDVILVTGYPGQSVAGLQLLLRSLAPREHPVVSAYIHPSHRAREGAAIAETAHATAMIDTSDGFLGDLGHICEESRVGAQLFQERLPISKGLMDAASLLKEDPMELFFRESDDYELIITCAPSHRPAIQSAVTATYDGPVTEVGRITEWSEGIRLILRDGSQRILVPSGWDHFR
jgi:thiamine-monophosphate kinase